MRSSNSRVAVPVTLAQRFLQIRASDRHTAPDTVRLTTSLALSNASKCQRKPVLTSIMTRINPPRRFAGGANSPQAFQEPSCGGRRRSATQPAPLVACTVNMTYRAVSAGHRTRLRSLPPPAPARFFRRGLLGRFVEVKKCQREWGRTGLGQRCRNWRVDSIPTWMSTDPEQQISAGTTDQIKSIVS